MPFSFKGGVHPDDKKSDTRKKAIEVLPPPKTVILPVSMHIGAPCTPLVKVGDHVKIGQRIADSDAAVSSPVHASVSGIVSMVEPHAHPNGTNVMSIVIENDFQDEISEEVKAVDRFHSITPDELAEIVRNAGIVGLGGAAFPTHIKIRAAVTDHVDTLIINAAECEPYITADNRLMLERAEDLCDGIMLLKNVLSIKNAFIGIESNKRHAIDHLREVLKKYGDIKLSVLHTKYPQGAEKHLVKAVTGREIPPGKLPSHVGVININVASTISILDAVKKGSPLTERVVTVSGSAVANPKNLLVRIGTPINDLFEFTGGFRDDPYKILMGGPMMGIALFDTNVPVIKGTNALLAFCENEDKISPDQTCIRCGKCVSACPMNLMPIYLNMYGSRNMLERCESLNITDCIECGCCSYICPARIHLVQSLRKTKQAVIAEQKKRGV